MHHMQILLQILPFIFILYIYTYIYNEAKGYVWVGCVHFICLLFFFMYTCIGLVCVDLILHLYIN